MKKIISDVLKLGASKVYQGFNIPSKLLKKKLTSSPTFYTLVSIHPLLTHNFHQP